MSAHLSETFSKELKRAAYDGLPIGVDRERLRHEVAICGAGGVVRNLIFVARLVLYRSAKTTGPTRQTYPTPPELPSHELSHLERCADRVLKALEVEARAA